MSLKELTKENHSNAERQEFVKIMFSGKINPDLYATYLFNQFPIYEVLEVCSMPHGLFSNMIDVLRAKKIWEDYTELWGDRTDKPATCPVVEKYVKHILSIKSDPDRLMAHIYVRHMGDLAGGQMIAKRVPGSGKYYQFLEPDLAKEAIRSRINDSMAEEARICFDFATQLFKEMMMFVEYQEETDEK